MTKTVVVGDLHGQYELAEKVLESEHDVVFIGDYLDSFRRTIHDQIKTLDVVLEACREPRVTALKGNHELSYLEPRMMCSGYKHSTQEAVRDRDLSVLEDYTWAEGFLISHAGIAKGLLEFLNVDYETYLREKDFYQIGFARGGSCPVGGLFWCDFHFEFECIDIPQIVGHTRGKEIRQIENSYCIDCLEDDSWDVLLIEGSKAEIVDLREL